MAAERGAIGTLLISDKLFRSGDAKERNKYVEMVEGVRGKGGEVVVFSSMHETGEREFSPLLLVHDQVFLLLGSGNLTMLPFQNSIN